METLSLLRRSLLGLAGYGLGLALMATVARSDEVVASGAASGIVIHDPQETLRDFCRQEDGALWLVLPNGARFELVTSTSDPAIANPGDGAFHPFDESVVREALQVVRFPLPGISADVYLLPYPRRESLRSAAGPGLILLSPGVTPLSAELQHSQVAHELGHVVQYVLMPDAADERWARYREMRGITDPQRFCEDGLHADRPHEIFAEDFRALFGDALANYSGTIENPALPMPQTVQGLDGFLLGLAGVTMAAGELEAYPNPARGAVSLRRPGGEASPVDLFDAAGRKVTTLSPTASAGGWSWRWDGLDARGLPVAPGLMFARVRGSTRPASRFLRLR